MLKRGGKAWGGGGGGGGERKSQCASPPLYNLFIGYSYVM